MFQGRWRKSTVALRQSAEMFLTLMPAPQNGGQRDIPCRTTVGFPAILGMAVRARLRIEAADLGLAVFRLSMAPA
ncbi:hypothetical protein GCM10009715_29970 [Paeniglutamicibacter psychrophenolicus]